MRTLLAIASLSFAALATSTALGATTDVGSPVIDRNNNDAAGGVIYLYLGGTQPIVGPATVAQWSFFDNEPSSAGFKVTPLIFEVTGANQWKLVTIGTTRSSTGAGAQTHAFGALAGSASLDTSKQYTFGFTHRGYTLQGPNVVADGGYSGVVDFNGYNIFTDRWAYAYGTASIGMLFGTGGTALDPQGFGGRIYSASFSLNGGTPAVVAYCTAGTSTNGCVPSISALGLASVSNSAGFSINVANVEGSKQGLIFYGISGRVASPWSAGSTSLICVKPPTQRMLLLSSGGSSGQCNGAFSTDWLAFLAATPSALGEPFGSGATVNAQAWYRDPPAIKTTNLSNALEFITLP